MTTEKLSAESIAEQQLIAALQMWKQRNWVPSITLAGAAEEILGKRLRRIGMEPSFDNMLSAVIKIAKGLGETDSRLEKDVAYLINSTKNELKHYSGDEDLEFNLREDAAEILDRAIANFTMLTNSTLPEFLEYWAESHDA
jgi:hypothetical protein